MLSIASAQQSIASEASSIKLVNDDAFVLRNPRFDRIHKIGSGVYGRVWKAMDKHLNAQVAIKHVVHSISASSFGLQVELLREISIMHRMDNKHVVKLLDVEISCSISATNALIIQELQDIDLEAWMQRQRGEYSLLEVETILTGILKGCDYLHGMQVMHRDIKPSNILLNLTTMTAKLSDFGWAKTWNSKQNQRCFYPIQVLCIRKGLTKSFGGQQNQLCVVIGFLLPSSRNNAWQHSIHPVDRRLVHWVCHDTQFSIFSYRY